ncbi:hypothetical protein F4V57_03905 [Acinetobacter qingfengensis]|uniref:Uncharacterized protein n=1 Tax=Acinetobacter qingfengensis TaxID=1262585 RepID=A0A1E7RC00_9GAMM|nr:hypothetical protein [Acinetobacter qingfengensis]KAA8734912.1 hypothetical protein F4V57_03905 [Acinetobacter qingfengensis]OEY96920.1 hypothetical protein BJI46_11600 [Acinetobacter qingfengensis]
MSNLTPEKKFSNVRKLETNDPASASTFNNQAQQLLNRTEYLHSFNLYKTLTSASNHTIDVTQASNFYIVLTAATQIQFATYSPDQAEMRSVNLLLKQDAVGNRKVTWASNIKWSQGRQPVLSFDPNVTDIINLFTTDGGQSWYGSMSSGWIE